MYSYDKNDHDYDLSYNNKIINKRIITNNIICTDVIGKYDNKKETIIKFNDLLHKYELYHHSNDIKILYDKFRKKENLIFKQDIRKILNKNLSHDVIDIIFKFWRISKKYSWVGGFKKDNPLNHFNDCVFNYLVCEKDNLIYYVET